MNNKLKRLVIAADDYGYSAEVNQGILQLIEQGALTVASCLVTAPQWQQAAQSMTTEHSAQADIGLHLDLTEFANVTQANSAAGGSHLALTMAAYAASLQPERVKQVIAQQLDRFEQSLGFLPAYIDGHRHVHQLPVVRQQLLAVVRERYQDKNLPWIRISKPLGCPKIKGFVIAALGSRGLKISSKQHNIPHSTRLLGVYDFSTDPAAHQTRLNSWAAMAQDGDVLMVHPAAKVAAETSQTNPTDNLLSARLMEFELLSSDWWRNSYTLQGVVLARGSAIFK